MFNYVRAGLSFLIPFFSRGLLEQPAPRPGVESLKTLCLNHLGRQRDVQAADTDTVGYILHPTFPVEIATMTLNAFHENIIKNNDVSEALNQALINDEIHDKLKIAIAKRLIQNNMLDNEISTKLLNDSSTHETVKIAIMDQTCPICMKTFDQEESSQLRLLSCCNSLYCVDCLYGFFKESIDLKCPNPVCRHNLTEQDMQRIIRDQQKIDQLREAFIQKWMLKETKACPTPECPQRFYKGDICQGVGNCPICDKEVCGTCFCSHKESEPCKEMVLNERARNFIKPCPSCATLIEHFGSYYMTCTVCNYKFCWECMKPWQSVFEHTCDQ